MCFDTHVSGSEVLAVLNKQEELNTASQLCELFKSGLNNE